MAVTTEPRMTADEFFALPGERRNLPLIPGFGLDVTELFDR